MSEPTLFEQENKVIEAAEQLAGQGAVSPDDFQELLKQYKKLFKHFDRIVKLNDRQQNALKSSEDNLKAEIEKRNEVEARLRENEVQLVKAKEVAEQALEDKARFFASMSHEIRTPLNGVLGSAQLLNTTELGPEQSEYISTIISSGKILMVVINDILDFSKLESGKLELERIPVDLEDLVEQAMDLCTAAAKGKGLAMIFRLNALDRCILADSTRLSQVLVNLVNNAVKFTEKGFICVSAEEQIGPQGTELLFRVQDTGIGIPQSRINKLFQEFSQVDASTTRKYGGTGLGLAICQKLTQLWGGHIWAESEEGKGSNFCFTLPLLFTEQATRPTHDTSTLRGKSCLILTHLDPLREKLQGLCQQVGMRPLPTSTIAQAEQAFPEADLLIIDQQYPTQEGLDIYHMLNARLLEPKPLLLLNTKGVALNHDLLTDIPGGVFPKPVKRLNLYPAMQRALAGEALVELEKSTAMTYERVADQHPLNILLAEDNPINQKIALATFKLLGYSADLAENGKKAVDMARAKHYDLVFMDMQMPEMDGLAATRLLRHELGDQAPLVIAMTANAASEDVQACLAAGMTSHLSKPLVIEKLVDCIKEHAPAGRYTAPAPAEPPPAPAAEGEGETSELFDVTFWQHLNQTYPPDLLDDLTSFYNKEMLDNLPLLQQHVDNQDLAELKKLAHRLKGSSLNLGVKGMGSVLAALEEDASQGVNQRLQSYMSHLQTMMAPTAQGIKTFIPQRPS